MESSAPAKNGWKTRLLSPNIPAGGKRCMKFAYSMNGQSTGTPNPLPSAKYHIGGTFTREYYRIPPEDVKWYINDDDDDRNKGICSFDHDEQLRLQV